MPEGAPANSGAALPQTIIAFDFGLRRIGIAVGNTLTGSAEPLDVIDDESNDVRFRRITSLVDQWRPDRLVVGRPVHPH